MGNHHSHNHSSSHSNNNAPLWAKEEYWPSSNDTVQELERKRDMNLQAATSEIVLNTICPERIEDGEVTEYQSNAIRANDIIESKKE